jgi:hypothetical protein
MMTKLSPDDIERIEQALAVLSGVAPRGWIVVDGPLTKIGNVTTQGTVGQGLSCMLMPRHADNMEIGIAIAIILNDAGRLLLELRRSMDPAAG